MSKNQCNSNSILIQFDFAPTLPRLLTVSEVKVLQTEIERLFRWRNKVYLIRYMRNLKYILVHMIAAGMNGISPKRYVFKIGVYDHRKISIFFVRMINVCANLVFVL